MEIICGTAKHLQIPVKKKKKSDKLELQSKMTKMLF